MQGFEIGPDMKKGYRIFGGNANSLLFAFHDYGFIEAFDYFCLIASAEGKVQAIGVAEEAAKDFVGKFAKLVPTDCPCRMVNIFLVHPEDKKLMKELHKQRERSIVLIVKDLEIQCVKMSFLEQRDNKFYKITMAIHARVEYGS